eukprot:sb/3474522/
MIIFVAFAISVASAFVPKQNVLSSPGLLNAEFARFQKLQGRSYRPAEMRMRFRIFRDNLAKIVQCNEDNLGFTCEENMFTDLSDDERQAYTGLSNITDNGPLASRAPLLSNGVGAPDSKDWRDLGKVTGVKDQGQW